MHRLRSEILKTEVEHKRGKLLPLRRAYNHLVGGRRNLPIKTKDVNIGIEIEICCYNPDDARYDELEELTYFGKHRDSSIVCDRGNAIEFVLRWDTVKCQGCNRHKVMRDTHGMLLCSHCWELRHYLPLLGSFVESRGPWSDKNIVRPQKWFLEKKNILKDVKIIKDGCTECGKNEHGQSSCGLHVHVSHPRITKEKYPDFGSWLMEYWAMEEQGKMMKKWNLRGDNTYCKRNEGCYFTEKDEKYLQMNILNSVNGPLWHVEFRGHDGFNPSKKNATRRLEKYVDDVATLFVNMFRSYKRGKIASSKKTYSEDLIKWLVSGVGETFRKAGVSLEDRIRQVRTGLRRGRIPKDFKGYTGENLLFLAEEDPDMVQVLLEQGVDPNTITFYYEGETTRSGDDIPLSLLLWTIKDTGTADRKRKNNVRIRALLKQHGAVFNGILLSMLFDTENVYGYYFDADSVHAILEYGVSPHDTSAGDSLLNMCVHNTENSNYLAMAEVLLDAGANPNRDPGCWLGVEDKVLDLFVNRGFTPSNDVFEEADNDYDMEQLKMRFPTVYAEYLA